MTELEAARLRALRELLRKKQKLLAHEQARRLLDAVRLFSKSIFAVRALQIAHGKEARNPSFSRASSSYAASDISDVPSDVCMTINTLEPTFVAVRS